jgi:hypothetical protein
MKSAVLARGEKSGGFHPPYDDWNQYEAARRDGDKSMSFHLRVARYQARQG